MSARPDQLAVPRRITLASIITDNLFDLTWLWSKRQNKCVIVLLIFDVITIKSIFNQRVKVNVVANLATSYLYNIILVT